MLPGLPEQEREISGKEGGTTRGFLFRTILDGGWPNLQS